MYTDQKLADRLLLYHDNVLPTDFTYVFVQKCSPIKLDRVVNLFQIYHLFCLLKTQLMNLTSADFLSATSNMVQAHVVLLFPLCLSRSAPDFEDPFLLQAELIIHTCMDLEQVHTSTARAPVRCKDLFDLQQGRCV